jgi:hypothetical protein
VTFDTFGNMFIADYNNQQVRKVLTNGTIFTIAGTGAAGGGGDRGAADQAQLNGPIQATPDSSGTIYISEYDANRVRTV